MQPSSKASGRAGVRRMGFVLGAVFAIGGCAYTVERTWGRGTFAQHLPPHAPGGAEGHARFRSDLADCVAADDPERLNELENGGEYRLSGWLLSSRRKDVRSCLHRKGYLGVPKVLAP